jgi:transposase
VSTDAAQRIAELEAMVVERDGLLAERDAKIAVLVARVEKLEAQLNRNSSNSSRPPSSDPPWSKSSPKRKNRSGRKRGGQKGHKGHRRELLPAEAIRNTTEVYPDQCCRCGSRHMAAVDSEPLRHQVTDLPPVEPVTDEWRLHEGECQDCGAVTRAELPDGVPRGAFGPGVVGLVGLLTGAYRLGKRAVKQILADLFGVYLSLGSVIGCEREVSEAVAEPVDEAGEYIDSQAVVHADETIWRQCAEKIWLWVAATPLVSVFLILPDRSAESARFLLGKFEGILVSDRFKGYLFWSMGKRQACWAHLARDFIGFSEQGGVTGEIGAELVSLTDTMFEWWHRVRDGTMARTTFRRKMGPLRRSVEDLLAEGAHDSEVPGKFKDILKHGEALWTFVRVEGVEPTNNMAERDLRHGVILRKVSLGTQSEAGSLYVERVLTVVATLRKQGRSIHAFLTEACRARLTHCAPPSLLPDAASDHAA